MFSVRVWQTWQTPSVSSTLSSLTYDAVPATLLSAMAPVVVSNRTVRLPLFGVSIVSSIR